MPPAPLVFGRVAHPPFRDRLVPDGQTTAWDDLGQRTPVGVCWHTMVGTLWGTDTYFRTGAPALTDYGIGGATDGAAWDGVILRWNDPRGRRAGWANGGSDGLEGDGPLFVRTRGVDAINRDLVSIERSDGGDPATPLSPRQADGLCRLTAHWFDQAGVAWDRFPVNPSAGGGGIVTHLLHLEFARKGCPHAAVVDRVEELQGRVRAILRAAQTEGPPPVALPPPIPPATPVAPDHAWWPPGYDLPSLTSRFGRLARHDATRPDRVFGFDARGVISNAWVARGMAEHRTVRRLPPAADWWVLPTDGDPHDLVTFAAGWTLFRPSPTVAWRWIV